MPSSTTPPTVELPRNVQPYGTVVTKDYPDDIGSDLDPPDRWRVNVHVDSKSFVELVGEEPRSLSRPRDHAAADVVNPHPVYGALSWICVVNPGERTAATVLKLLQDAHGAARLRYERRAGMDRGEAGLNASRRRDYSSELMNRPARSAAAARSSFSTSRVSSSRENLPSYPISSRAATVSAKSTCPFPML